MKASPRFTTKVMVPFPGEQREALRWLNIQHTGRPTMALLEPCSEEHVKASHNIWAVRIVELEFEVDKEGNWKLVEARLGGQ